jgi:uncharacterized protein YuzE
MAYKLKYDPDADVLLVLLKEKGKLSYAEEVGDIVMHMDSKGRPLFFEILNASKVVSMMVQAMATGEAQVITS